MKGLPLLCLICGCVTVIKAIIEEKMLITTLDQNEKYYRMMFYLGTTNVMKQLEIDQERDALSFYYMFYSAYLSTSVQFLGQTQEYDIFEDNFTFANQDTQISILNFPFQVISDYGSRLNSYFKSGIGLAYKYTNESYSLTHQLRKLGVIDHLSYALIPHNSQKSGYLVFGGIPYEMKHGKVKGTCTVTQAQSKWSCRLSAIIIGGERYENKVNSFFQAAERYINAPFEFTDYLINTFFKKDIASHRCFSSDNKVVYCEEAVIKSFPSISFVFDKKVYVLESRDLFETLEGYYRFVISPHISSNTTWVFGTSFLNQFFSVFDYENGVVEFYSEDKIIDVEAYKGSMINKSSNSQYVMSVLIVLLFIGVLGLLYNKYIR